MMVVANSVHLYSEYLTKEALEGFGDFNVGQVIHTVKYANDLVLLAKEEAVLQGMIERVIEIGRICVISRQPFQIQILIDQNSQRMWNISTIWVA